MLNPVDGYVHLHTQFFSASLRKTFWPPSRNLKINQSVSIHLTHIFPSDKKKTEIILLAIIITTNVTIPQDIKNMTGTSPQMHLNMFRYLFTNY